MSGVTSLTSLCCAGGAFRAALRRLRANNAIASAASSATIAIGTATTTGKNHGAAAAP